MSSTEDDEYQEKTPQQLYDLLLTNEENIRKIQVFGFFIQ